MIIIRVLMLVGFALLGRWMQLHPERIVPKGWFIGENTFGARLLRAQATVVGGFAVLAGTAFALSTALVPLTSGHSVLQVIVWLLAVTLGILAVSYVRKEVKRQPLYRSTSPHRWP